MKQLRERLDLSQEDLARELKVSVSTVQKWDQQQSFPRLYPKETVVLIKVLKCTLDELVEAQDNWEKRKAEKSS